MLKETEIRPDSLMAEQNRLYMLDIEDLLKYRKDFVFVACPACDANNNKKVWEKYTLDYVECNNCKTVFINRRPTPKILDLYYSNSRNYEYWNKYIFPSSEEVRRKKIFKPRAELINGLCIKYGTKLNTLVEVGAGYGTFCEEVKKMNLFERVIAVEPTPSLAATCRQKGIEVFENRIEDVKFDFLADVIVNFEVIEHLFSPKKFLEDCNKILSESGKVMITCPNVGGFDIMTLGKISNSVDTEHLNYFNIDSLQLLFERCGFKVIEKLTPGKLDAELVRKKILNREFDVKDNPFLEHILVDKWEELGEQFQNFISQNNLSSNMLFVAEKISEV